MVVQIGGSRYRSCRAVSELVIAYRCARQKVRGISSNSKNPLQMLVHIAPQPFRSSFTKT